MLDFNQLDKPIDEETRKKLDAVKAKLVEKHGYTEEQAEGVLLYARARASSTDKEKP